MGEKAGNKTKRNQELRQRRRERAAEKGGGVNECRTLFLFTRILKEHQLQMDYFFKLLELVTHASPCTRRLCVFD